MCLCVYGGVWFWVFVRTLSFPSYVNCNFYKLYRIAFYLNFKFYLKFFLIFLSLLHLSFNFLFLYRNWSFYTDKKILQIFYAFTFTEIFIALNFTLDFNLFLVLNFNFFLFSCGFLFVFFLFVEIFCCV